MRLIVHISLRKRALTRHQKQTPPARDLCGRRVDGAALSTELPGPARYSAGRSFSSSPGRDTALIRNSFALG